MIEIQANIFPLNATALTLALQAASVHCQGLSTYGQGRPISLWLDDAAQPSDQVAVQTAAAAHDPVFLSVDKTTIAANGNDAATITVNAPKQNAAPVTLSVNGLDLPITLTNGVGTDTITALDPTTITIQVKNPANRSMDVLTIVAK